MYNISKLEWNDANTRFTSDDSRYIMLDANLKYNVDNTDMNTTLCIYYDTCYDKLYAFSNCIRGLRDVPVDTIITCNKGLVRANLTDIDHIIIDERYITLRKWWNSIDKTERDNMMNRIIVDSTL